MRLVEILLVALYIPNQRAATPGCEGASLCGIVLGVVGLLVDGGVRTVEVRPGAPSNLMKKSLNLL